MKTNLFFRQQQRHHVEQKHVRVGNMVFGVCVLVETVGEWNVRIEM